MLTGLLKIINGKLHYRDNLDRGFVPVPEVGTAVGARAYGGALGGGKSYANAGRDAVNRMVEKMQAAGYTQALDERDAARADAAFWKEVAARRKERCNYLADEMRKYRDQPAELFIPVVRDTLHASGAKTLQELIAQRDIERIARQELIAQRDSAHAELTQLRLVNDKLQKAVEDAAALTSSVNYERMRELMAKEHLRADQNGLDLAMEKQKVSGVRREYFAMRERAEKAEADARVKGENLKTAKELLLRCANFISHVITTQREPGHIYDVATGFLRDSSK